MREGRRRGEREGGGRKTRERKAREKGGRGGGGDGRGGDGEVSRELQGRCSIRGISAAMRALCGLNTFQHISTHFHTFQHCQHMACVGG